jgi:hypothetical protein
MIRSHSPRLNVGPPVPPMWSTSAPCRRPELETIAHWRRHDQRYEERAGNLEYRARALREPRSNDELEEIVRASSRLSGRNRRISTAIGRMCELFHHAECLGTSCGSRPERLAGDVRRPCGGDLGTSSSRASTNGGRRVGRPGSLAVLAQSNSRRPIRSHPQSSSGTC